MSETADEVEARLRELAEAREVVTATGRRLQQRLDELDARERSIAERERALEERGRNLDARERALKAAADAADKMRRRLQRDERGAADAPAPAPEPAPPPDAAAQTKPAGPVGASGYNVERLEQLVEANADRFPDQAGEWRSYVYFLREHAGADGALPSSFDYLVDDVFGPLLER